MTTSFSYSKREENLNFLSHAFATLFFTGLGYFVTSLAVSEFGWNLKTFSVLNFFVCGTFAFFASALYHGSKGKLKPKFKLLDHIAIFFMTFGVVSVASELSDMPRFWAHSLSLSMLILAIIGSIMKVKMGTDGTKKWSLYFYTLMPCAIFIPFFYISKTALLLFIIAGIVDAIGLSFYVKKNLEFTHSIWHIFSFLTALFDSAAIYSIITNL